jgi:GT2 family glycosyltransferase
VVVPTRDRPGQLSHCVRALAQLDFPRELWELIVVDDGGGAVVDEPGLPLTLLRRPPGGPASARNAGIAAARGDYVAFTDDDCEPDPGWLAALADAFDRFPDAMLGGRIVNALTANVFSSASQRATDLAYAHYNRDPVGCRFFASNNLAVPRRALLALGGFDADRFPFASEDRDLCDRWRAGGARMVYVPGALVRHRHDLDLTGFCRQHFAYGRGAARYHAARAQRASGRLVDEVSFHLDPRLWRSATAAGPAGAALLALWQLCNALGFAWERAPRLGLGAGR